MEGIKNSREMLELVAVLAEALKEAKADGKINVFDLPKLAPVIPALRSAVEKSELIPAELKDLDKDELTELLTLTVDAVMKLLDAVFKVHAA
jgi:diadenosine tetraphosphate (Ap4A) HIT family hydrolase